MISIARYILVIALIAALMPLHGYAADPAPGNAKSSTAIELLNGIRADMRSARTDVDWHAYLSAARRQSELLNASPMSRLEIARAQAHLEDFDAAFDALGEFVHMDQSHELLESLPDLAPLRERPRFAAIRARAAENRKSIARSSLALRIDDRSLLPEDIDYDPRKQRFLISSVLRNKIVTVTKQGTSADFALSPDGWPMFAVKIDHRRQLLWATEVAMKGFSGVHESAQGRSAVLCYELASGKLLQRIEGPRPSALGDIALAPDGSVIVSDGEQGGIYRLRQSDDHLDRIDGGDFISPQTVVVERDGDRIIVSDYLRGLGLLETKSKRVTWLSSQGRYALNGIDGLYRSGRKLIAVQNGTMPARVTIFSLNSRGTKIIGEKIIERSTATLGDPTHGVIVDSAFYYIANSGWDAVDEKGKVKLGMDLPQSVVMKIELHAR